MLNLADATPGYYLVRSASPTIYVVDLRTAEPLVARVCGGRPEDSQDFLGDNRWWPLEQVLSWPSQDEDGPGPDGVLENVLRLGRRHKWVWRTQGLESQYRVQGTATAIEGPLTAAGLLEQLPPDRPRSLIPRAVHRP